MKTREQIAENIRSYNDHLHRCIKVEVVVRNIYNRNELVTCIKKALTKKGYDGIYTLFVTEQEEE